MDGLTPEQARLRDRARELAQEAAAQAAETDRTEQYPWPMVRRMTEAGLMGLTVPQAFGGPGGSYLDAVLVIEEMAKASPSAAASRSRRIWALSARSWPMAARRSSGWRPGWCWPAASRRSASPSPVRARRRPRCPPAPSATAIPG